MFVHMTTHRDVVQWSDSILQLPMGGKAPCWHVLLEARIVKQWCSSKVGCLWFSAVTQRAIEIKGAVMSPEKFLGRGRWTAVVHPTDATDLLCARLGKAWRASALGWKFEVEQST